MGSTKTISRALLILVPLLFVSFVFADDDDLVDDTIPEVTARVARISFISGGVKIKRSDSEEWEEASLNLPIVEGDEIASEADGRVEIQFDTYSHVRLAERALLKVTNLADEGIALSLSEGTMTARLTAFDIDKSYFEVDGPRTTISMQKAGMYRIDAGGPNDSEVRVSVTEKGEARVYAENSGFTLKNGRSATINISGNYAGEWNIVAADKYADEFDSWSLNRDSVVAKSLQEAYYDQYYDRDIYGAEELSDYGQWIHTKKYGYVWRPNGSATRDYANWSPYRYGQWRWVPQYGWTWVNDEPWGWATYHHGRWVYDLGSWYWSPYGYYRNTRSWWSPALVILRVYGGNICWYPLGYSSTYYNYNYYYGGYHGGNYGHNRPNNRPHGNNNGGNGPRPSPTPASTPITGGPERLPPVIGGPERLPPVIVADQLPGGTVITAPFGSFGKKKDYIPATPTMSKTILKEEPNRAEPILILPTTPDARLKANVNTRVPRPEILTAASAPVKTGAAVRTSQKPLDPVLKNAKIRDNRENAKDPEPTRDILSIPQNTRKTGVVQRPVIVDSGGTTTSEPVKVRRTDTESQPEPVRVRKTEPPQQRPDEPVRVPRSDPPPQKSEPVRVPRNDPPPQKSEPVRVPRNDPPPQKSEPKNESKPAPEQRKGKG